MASFRRLVIGSAVVALALTGCATKTADGGTLNFLTEDQQFAHLDPQRNYVASDIAFAATYLQRTLTMYRPSGGAAGTELIPDLATDLGTPSADAKSWSFTLRDGAKFEDGSAITCADVKYGVSRTFATDVVSGGPDYAIRLLDIPLAIDGASAYRGPYKNVNNDTAAFDKAVVCSADDKTITFNLKKPASDFNHTVSMLAFSPVPAELDTRDQYDLDPVSSGPYVVSEYTPGSELVLDRNENWSSSTDSVRRALPGQIVVTFAQAYQTMEDAVIEDGDAGKTAVMLDPVAAAGTSIIFNLQRTANRRVSAEDPFVSYTAFNVSKLPCLKVRQAIFYALDRKAIAELTGPEEYVGGYADGLLKPTLFPDVYAPVKGYEDARPEGNPAKAAQLLAEAKSACPAVYQRVTKTGIVFDTTNLPIHQAGLAIWIASMAKVGIKLRGNLIDKNQYYGVVFDPSAQGDLSRAGWAPDWMSPSTVIPDIAGGGTFNLLRNEKDGAYASFAATIAKAQAETDEAKRNQLWRAANQTVMDNMWVLPGVFSKSQFIWGSGVGGVDIWTPYGCPNFNDIYVTSAA